MEGWRRFLCAVPLGLIAVEELVDSWLDNAGGLGDQLGNSKETSQRNGWGFA